MTITSPRFAFYLLLFVCFVWGAEFVLVDLSVAQLPTNTFNTLRFFVAGLALLPLLYFSKTKIPNGQLKPLFKVGLSLGALLFVAFYTQTEGVRFTSVSNAAFITGMNVPLVSILGFILFKNRTSWPAWLGIITATIGLYFLTTDGNTALNKGDFLVLLCAFAFALHIIFTGLYVKKLPVLSLSIIQIFAVALYSLIAALLSGEPMFYHLHNAPITWNEQLLQPLIIISILITGILGTSLAYWAQSASQQILPAHKVALIFASEPIFAHFSAWIFLDEKLGLMGFVGAALIILGMLISELGDKNHPPQVNALDQTATAP